MKVISKESAIELQEYMPDETEYVIMNEQAIWTKFYDVQLREEAYGFNHEEWDLSTLTLDEAIEMLPARISWWDLILDINKDEKATWPIYYIAYVSKWDMWNEYFYTIIWETLLEAVESMLLYLHREWLLTPNK